MKIKMEAIKYQYFFFKTDLEFRTTINTEPIVETTKNNGVAMLLKSENNSSPKIPRIGGIKTKPMNIFSIFIILYILSYLY